MSFVTIKNPIEDQICFYGEYFQISFNPRYIFSSNNESNHVSINNVEHPESFQTVEKKTEIEKTFTHHNFTSHLSIIRGNYLYVESENDILVYNVEDPLTPIYVGTFSISQVIGTLADFYVTKDNQYLHVVDGYSSSTTTHYKILKIDDLDCPLGVCSCESTFAYSFSHSGMQFKYGTYIYVSEDEKYSLNTYVAKVQTSYSSPTYRGYAIFDLSDPEDILSVDVYYSQYIYHTGLDAIDDNLFVGYYNPMSQGEGGISNLDYSGGRTYSDGYNPIYAFTTSEGIGYGIEGMPFGDDSLFFVVFNITDPKEIVPITKIQTKLEKEYEKIHLQIVEPYVYLSHSSYGLQIFDISNHLNPIEIASYEYGTGKLSRVMFGNDYLLLADSNDGLAVIKYSEVTIKGICEVGYSEIEVEGCTVDDVCANTKFNLIGKCRNLECSKESGGEPTKDCSKCSCYDGYFGDYCQYFKCGGNVQIDPIVCEGIGFCISPEICNCPNTTIDANFEYDNLCNKVCNFGTILFDGNCQDAIASGIIIVSCVGLCLTLFVIFILFLFVTLFFLKVKKKNKKFENIEGIDILLQEQELEKNINTPKIKVKRSDCIVDFKEIKLVKILSEGAQGTVFLAHWRDENVAYKGFSMGFGEETNSEKHYEEFEKEISILANLRHPSIIQFYGACINPPRIGYIMNFCKNGDIPSFFSSYLIEKKKPYPTNERIRIIKEITSGMNFLHSKSIIHRDLKPENVLIDDNEKAKIMDFGLIKLKKNAEQTMTKQIGTSYYMSPEVIRGSKYSFPTDIYSWAVTVYVIITNQYSPYGRTADHSGISLMHKVSKNPNFRPKIDEEDFEDCQFLIPIIEKCWNHDPAKRYSFEELIDLLKK